MIIIISGLALWGSGHLASVDAGETDARGNIQEEMDSPAPSQSRGSGAERQTARPLTLDDCLKIALDKNPASRAARAGIRVAREGTEEARAPYYPDLGVNAGYSRWQKHAFLPAGISRPGMASVIGPTNDWGAGIKARYTLFDSGERSAKLRTALAAKGVAEEDAARIRQEIRFDVHQSFYSLISAVQNQSVAGEQMARAKEHLRLAGERKEAGAAPRADVIRARVEVGETQLDLVRAQNLVRIARGTLNTSMGLPVETEITVEAPPEKIQSPAQTDLPGAFARAVSLRPEIKAAGQRVEAARSQIDGARSAYGPKLKAEGGYGWRDTAFLPQDQDWLIGAFVEWPIFTGFSRKHRLARTEAELSKEEAEAEQTLLKIRQEVWAAHSRLREAFEAIQASEAQVEDAHESMRLAEERYKVGAGTMNDLLDAQTALARAEARHVESHWEYQIARTGFRRSVGELASPSKP